MATNTINPVWDFSGFMHRFDQGRYATWFKERQYDTRPTWKQLFDAGVECFNWLIQDPATEPVCFTTRGVCLVATLCYQYGGTYHVYHGTIPRGGFLDTLWDAGALKAETWFAAARKYPHPNDSDLTFHAEDGVLYTCETAFKTLNPAKGCEAPRMVVCGANIGRSVKRYNICSPCRKIGRGLKVKMLLKGSARDLDKKDRREKALRKRAQRKEKNRREWEEQQWWEHQQREIVEAARRSRERQMWQSREVGRRHIGNGLFADADDLKASFVVRRHSI